MSEEFRSCDATLHVGDGGVFSCKLRALHGGRHTDEGVKYEKYAYFIKWEGDMRTVCEKCGTKTDRESFCRICHKEICENCLFIPKERPRTWDDHHCKECSPQEESLNPT